MVYDKKIKYLDYCENGERVRGSGFVKCELRNGSLKIEITVTGMSYDNGVTKDVILLSGDREIILGRIGIAEGRGQYFYLCQDAGNIADTGIGYGQLSGIRIPLGASREISCRWQPERPVAKQEASFHGVEGSQPERPVARQEASFHDAEGSQPERSAVRQEVFFRDAEDRPVVKEEAFFLNAEESLPERPTDKRVGSKQPEKKRIVLQGGNSRQEEKERKIRGEIKRESMMGRLPEEKRMPEDVIMEKAATYEAGTAEVQLAERQWQKGEQQPDEEPQKGEELRKKTEWEQRYRKDAAEKDFGREPSAGKSIVRERRGYGSTTGEKRKTERIPVVQRENKWDQLWAIYPHIRPFRDDREYLSIGPSDFVLFSSASYRMVNNSFLLHGYYNYHHLILVKVEKRGETYYYIGVPGNYYEREKQVAIMFGFESFECAEEPAQAGDFGYYMMRAEL